MNEETFVGFVELFEGRDDYYGHEEGRAVEWPDGAACGDPWTGHLLGSDPIGIYPLAQRDGEWIVKWGAVDFDEGEEDSLVYAKNLKLVLETFGVTGWIERSRSKGFHVWVFLDDWKPAGLVRAALLGATQIAGAPTKEINPKQTQMGSEKKGLGNYIRLPYPAMRQMPRREVLAADGDSMGIDQFVREAKAALTTTDQLQLLAELYVPPPKPVAKDHGPIDVSTAVMQRLDGLSFTILTKGPKPEAPDRSAALYSLCCSMLRGGTVTNEEAYDLLCQADVSWGKFIDRGDEAELRRMHDKVWSE